MSRATLAAVLACAALAVVGCSGTSSGSPTTPSKAATRSGTSQPTAKSSSGTTCDYATSTEDAARDVGKPPEHGEDDAAAVTLTTNHGEIAVRLATSIAPCTTRSFAHLAEKKYFDDTPCHRLTSAASLSVLQCGDPTGQGTGGPGYTIPDENPTHLKPATGRAVVYSRGTVAMANTGQPDSGGSQFFLVYADSTLPPTYAVFGTVDDAGLAVLDKIAAGGITPVSMDTDGSPTLPVTIQRAAVSSS